MRKILALAIVALMASPAMGAWIAASMGPGGFSEDFNAMAYWEDPAVGSPPTEYNWDTEEYDCIWKAEYGDPLVDKTYSLLGVNRWPTNAMFNTGQFTEWWASPDDRSIGGYGDSTTSGYVSVKLTNDTGGALDNLFVAYNHESWILRVQGNVSYSQLEVSSDAGTTWQILATDEFTPPAQAESANHWVNGNAAVNMNRIKGTYALDNTIAANAEFIVRWKVREHNYDDKRVGSSIDDIIVVPEPATLALMGLGLAGLAIRRRK